MNIISLIPSATEIIDSLGFSKNIVGRSHECDFPKSVLTKPICTAAKLNKHASSKEIDNQVKSILKEAISVYTIDDELVNSLKPDIVVTQSLCEVCAVSLKDVKSVFASEISSNPEIIALEPNDLSDIWKDIQTVADACNVPEKGKEVVDELLERIEQIRIISEKLEKPKV